MHHIVNTEQEHSLKIKYTVFQKMSHFHFFELEAFGECKYSWKHLPREAMYAFKFNSIHSAMLPS